MLRPWAASESASGAQDRSLTREPAPVNGKDVTMDVI
jgi:hypothetical protein